MIENVQTGVGPRRPFRVETAEATLADIRARLDRSHLAKPPLGMPGWSLGTDVDYLARLLAYWRDGFDWRAAEARLNRFEQFKMSVEGIDIHFYHVRGALPGRRALLLTHGWPGSVVEFLDVIDRLAHPERHGGVADDCFDVVVPSLPGFGFSGKPERPIGPRHIAGLWRRLMTEGLGYDAFFAQGGDWGAAITCWLGSDHADVVQAIHLNLFLGPAPQPDEDEHTQTWRADLAEVQKHESGYAHQQMTRPQSLGIALADTPIGFAGWILEKFQRWGDTGGDIESRFTMDTLLTNIMIYLVNDAVASSLWIYYAADHEPSRYSLPVAVPSGVALFPAEFLPIPPRTTAERVLTDLRRWSMMTAGGHFAALEEPVAFAAEVSDFFIKLDALAVAVEARFPRPAGT